MSDLRIYDYRNRMYQPELGRFLQPDPKQFEAGDYNLYRYCHNDPVNHSDPTGLTIVGKVVKILLGVRNTEKAGKELRSVNEAAQALKEGENVRFRSEKLAREATRQVGGGKTPIKEVDKATGQRHYHDADRAGGHALYGIASALTIAGSLPPESGKFERGGAYALDLFNPLSVLQDFLEIRDALRERSASNNVSTTNRERR